MSWSKIPYSWNPIHLHLVDYVKLNLGYVYTRNALFFNTSSKVILLELKVIQHGLQKVLKGKKNMSVAPQSQLFSWMQHLIHAAFSPVYAAPSSFHPFVWASSFHPLTQAPSFHPGWHCCLPVWAACSVDGSFKTVICFFNFPIATLETKFISYFSYFP